MGEGVGGGGQKDLKNSREMEWIRDSQDKFKICLKLGTNKEEMEKRKMEEIRMMK